MKYLLSITLCLLASIVAAAPPAFIGLSGGVGVVESYTTIANQEYEGDSSQDLSAYSLGQSFTSSGQRFAALSVYKVSGSAGNITCRVGSALDLSSNFLEQLTITVTLSNGWYRVESVTNPTLPNGTGYFVCAGSSKYLARETPASTPYTGGSYRYGTAGTYVLTGDAAANDLVFRLEGY